MPPADGGYLPAAFWLAQCAAMMGRGAEARKVFTRLLELRNDVGLLAEEYDPAAGRLVGNFPQAFSHVALVHTGLNLMKHEQEMAKATGQPAHNGRDADKLDPAATPDSGAAISPLP
jgi:hypothetical protein